MKSVVTHFDSAGEPFSAFMARALFDPQRGYYTRQIRTVGARGDFSTSATLSPTLGTAVGEWLKAEYRRRPKVRHIIEIGAGDGSLMQQVRKTLGLRHRWRFKCHIVEISATLRAQQQHRFGSRVRLHSTVEEALEHTGGDAFIYHHELLDAFPATLIQWSAAQQQWQEVWVPESLHPLHLDPAYFSALRHTGFADGQRCELHPSIREWLGGWTPHWKRGAMLSIDYGAEFPRLYHRRPQGTLRAYLLHQRLTGTDVYANPGRQDITADINFTDYRAWLRDCGLEEISHQVLADLLKPHCAPAQLLDADGAGGAFQCLVHRPAGS
ncbi:MAG: SAM-dependent methyltransferase [Prosthecobacter sp.]